MRVLMTADTVGGVWDYSLQLTRASAAHDIEVVLCTMGAPLSRSQREAVAALANASVHESRFQLEWMPDPWRDVQEAGEWLLAVAAAERPDIVHVNGYVHAALPWDAPVLCVAHSCVLSWWQAVHGCAAPADRARYADGVRAGLHAADLVIAPTRAMLAAVTEHYGAPRRGLVLSNGVDTALIAPRPKEPFVLAAGRVWDEAKNIAGLDAAAAHISWPLIIAGATESPDGSRAAAHHAQLAGLLGPAEMRDSCARAAIFAHPALYEPFGLAPLEAALHGCALVLGDIPSLREVWGDAAVYVDPRDRGQIASALQHLIDDEPARAALAERGRARARHFTARRMADGYRAAYTACVRHAREGVSCAS